MPKRPPPRSTPAKKPKAKRAPDQDDPPPAGMTLAQYETCLHWLANGHNASAAYKAAHPGVTDATARTEGSRILANPNIRAWLLAQLEDRWKVQHMSADEAQALVAGDARIDPRLLFDAQNKLRAAHDWPDEVAYSIRSVKVAADGSIEVRLNDSLAARRTVLELTGKLRGNQDGLRDLAEILAEKWKG